MEEPVWGQTEFCQDCEMEIEYPYYDPEKKGYIVTCKGCGKKMFLCDACLHADDNPEGMCDWYENDHGHGCMRGWIEN